MNLIWDLIYQWFRNNLDIVFFIYGLAFVALGIAILVQLRKKSEFKLANILWLLAGFGLIHGTNEFLDMWAIIKTGSPVLNTVHTFILVISYLFLFEFGRRFFRICEQKYLEKITKLFGWWLTLIIGLAVFIFGFTSTDFWKIGTIWARYLLGFPGGLLISFGFVLYYKYEEKVLEPLKVKKYFFWASFSFLVYGILGGLIVPKANFFPSNWVNTDSFLSVVRIPVQVFRAICSIIIVWAVCRTLRIFNSVTVEKLQREICTERKWAEDALKKANDDLKIRIQERTKELTKANELLKFEITERKRAEEGYKTILHTSIDGFWIVDIQGCFLDVNNAYCRLVGYSRDELLKMRISDVETAKRPEEIAQHIQKIMTVGGDRFETRHRCKDGKIVDIEISVNYTKEGGGQFFVFLRDITERKKAEEQQKALMNELEEMNKIMMGRELRMIELKKEVNRLSEELGRPKPYEVSSQEVE